MAFFERGNFRMHYEVIEGVLPFDTLFIHGNLASNIWWDPYLAEQKGRNLPGRAILAEWRGCGKSSGPDLEKELQLSLLADDYNSLLTHLGIEKVNVVGHSTGALIALQAMILAPELYQKAVFLDPVCDTGIKASPQALQAFQRMSQDKSFCADSILHTIHNNEIDSELKRRIVQDAFGVHPLIWHGVPKMLSEANLRPFLPKVTQPVLILHGELDTVLPVDDSMEMAKNLAKSYFYLMPGRGHSANVEDPKLFSFLLDGFLFG